MKKIIVELSSTNHFESSTNHLDSVTLLQKRSAQGGSTFATHTEHTPAFNTVHIIAAVIGIVGAIAVAVTVFIVCKRRRLQNTDTVHQVKADIEQNMTQRRASSTIHQQDQHRFGQFASDFDNNVQPPKPAVVHVEDVSPMIQQYQLQLKLLQQQQQERKSSSLLTVQVPHTHNRASSSSSNSSPNSLLPPPPYHP